MSAIIPYAIPPISLLDYTGFCIERTSFSVAECSTNLIEFCGINKVCWTNDKEGGCDIPLLAGGETSDEEIAKADEGVSDANEGMELASLKLLLKSKTSIFKTALAVLLIALFILNRKRKRENK